MAARDESVALSRVRRAEMVRAFLESIECRQRFAGGKVYVEAKGRASS